MTRVAFVTNLCPHYRVPLFERLAERFDVDFYFHSEGRDRFVSREMTSVSGAFGVVDTRRLSVFGQPLLPELASSLSSRRYDVVVKCLNGRLMVPFVYGLARARRLPLVIWTGMWHHPTTLSHQLTRRLTEHVYRGADSIVVYGDHVRSHLLAVRGVDDDKIFVAGQAVDAARFARRPAAFPNRPVILFVGQLEARKGIDVLLHAWAGVRDPAARLRLVGSGSDERIVREAATRDARIEVVGHLDQNALGDEIAAARCLVLPSVTTKHDREPWGLVVNEAFSAGLPAVVTDAVGAAAGGLVVDGRNGFVVPERDPVALAARLNRLVQERRLAIELGAGARVDVAAFTYERMADAFAAAIDHARGVANVAPASSRRAA